MADKTPPSEHPGRDLSFAWIAGVLREQDRAYEALVLRIQGWLAIATAVTGIGVPVGLSQIPGGLRLDWVPLASAAIPVGVFFLFTLIGWRALRPRPLQTLDHPEWIRTQFWDLQPEQFKRAMWMQLERAYLQNRLHLDEKSRAASLLRKTLPVLLLAVLGYAGWTAGIRILCDCP